VGGTIEALNITKMTRPVGTVLGIMYHLLSSVVLIF